MRRFYAAADLPAFAAAARDLLASTFECDEAELYFDDAPTAADAVAAAFATAAAAAAEDRAIAAAEGGEAEGSPPLDPAPPAAAAAEKSAGLRSSGTMLTGRWCACPRATGDPGGGGGGHINVLRRRTCCARPNKALPTSRRWSDGVSRASASRRRAPSCS